ncbi:hypothetical protein CLOM_g8524 [Closterium sp. NIES-68]|nr:hypothetical protein CLOM_g8524 [Closterium sp. NIES-68]GJP83771.1 hypothetical protein CLOP_g13883 [Closterium sp. NIES-67]
MAPTLAKRWQRMFSTSHSHRSPGQEHHHDDQPCAPPWANHPPPLGRRASLPDRGYTSPQPHHEQSSPFQPSPHHQASPHHQQSSHHAVHGASPQHPHQHPHQQQQLQQQRGLKHSTSRTSLDGADDDRPPGATGAGGAGGAEMVSVKLVKSDWLEIVNALESASSRCEHCGEPSPSAPPAVSLPATQRLFAQLKARSTSGRVAGANEDVLGPLSTARSQSSREGIGIGGGAGVGGTAGSSTGSPFGLTSSDSASTSSRRRSLNLPRARENDAELPSSGPLGHIQPRDVFGAAGNHGAGCGPNCHADAHGMHGANSELGPMACPHLAGMGGNAGGLGGGFGQRSLQQASAMAPTAYSCVESMIGGGGGGGGGGYGGGVGMDRFGGVSASAMVAAAGAGLGGGSGFSNAGFSMGGFSNAGFSNAGMSGVGRMGVSPSEILNRKLLTIITKAHDLFSKDQSPNGSKVGDYLLAQLLDLTKSKFGFVASALKKPEGTYYLKTHGITNFAWTRELRLWYAENAPSGLVFSNMETLFGRVVTTADVVISNDVPNDPRAVGVPPGHQRVSTFLGVPLFAGAELVGMFAVANRKEGYEETLLMEIQPMTKTVAQIVAALQERRREREEQERLRAMLKGTGDAILGVDDMGGISSLNRAARLLFGFTDIEGLGDGSGRAFGGAEMLPENLHVADLFISVDGRDDFADQGLEVFVCDGLRMPAIGRRILGGTLLLEIMLSRGSNPDVAYVITARELKNSGLGGTHTPPTLGSGSNSLARTGSKGGPSFLEGTANAMGGDE